MGPFASLQKGIILFQPVNQPHSRFIGPFTFYSSTLSHAVRVLDLEHFIYGSIKLRARPTRKSSTFISSIICLGTPQLGKTSLLGRSSLSLKLCLCFRKSPQSTEIRSMHQHQNKIVVTIIELICEPSQVKVKYENTQFGTPILRLILLHLNKAFDCIDRA